MPWRGPEVPGEYPTLGALVANWIEARCAIPDREQIGNPFLLTDDQTDFLLHFYRLVPETGEFYHTRGAQLVRPQKWGKGPLAAAIICAEAQGPVKFDGWDAAGEPVGKPWATPLIQITAISEDQTANVYSALLPMIELGALRAELDDTGLGRINLPGGGRIEPVTAAAISRLGQRLTFAVQDQTESWLASNKGRKLADAQRRNIAGMGGRWLSTPNAWDPTEDSVAQYTSEHEHDGVYHDDLDPPEGLSVRNKAERRRALRYVYGGAVTGKRTINGRNYPVKPWIDLDRIDAEISALLDRDPAQAERWFLNRKRSPESAVWNGAKLDALCSTHIPAAHGLIVVGIDGARFVDALAMIATEIETGHQWPLGIWERPESADDDYEHPFDQIDGALTEAFDTFDIWRVYIDPQYIDHLVTRWQGRWGEKRVLPWYTNRPRQMAYAVRRYSDAISAEDVSHNGDPQFVRHLKQAVRCKVAVWDDDHRQMYTVSKDRPGSPRKIDAAAAAVLSWEARSDAVAAGAKPKSAYRTRGWH